MKTLFISEKKQPLFFDYGSNIEATQQPCRLRWKIEQLHRELKQMTRIGTSVSVASIVCNAIPLRVVYGSG